MELLSVFYKEAVPKLKAVCVAAKTFNEGQSWMDGEKGEHVTVEEVFRGGAHAIKGTAANLRLDALSEAAKRLEAGGPPDVIRCGV